jgi:hypothetical protein
MEKNLCIWDIKRCVAALHNLQSRTNSFHPVLNLCNCERIINTRFYIRCEKIFLSHSWLVVGVCSLYMHLLEYVVSICINFTVIPIMTHLSMIGISNHFYGSDPLCLRK